MNFFLMILVNIAISIYLASRNKQKRTTISALAIDNGGLPIADETSNYNLSFGTVEITQGNCTWYGDYSTFKIYKKVKTEGGFMGFGSSTEKVEAANGYKIGFIMSLGYGEQNLKSIKVDSKTIYTNEILGSYDGSINKPKFFGLPEEEGGMAGNFSFYTGSDNQPKDSYFSGIVNRDVPNYPNKTYIVFKNFYIGNQNSLPTMSFVTSRFPHYNFLNNNYKEINKSCNPINIITDVLLSEKNGAGIPVSKLNTTSFLNAQAKLYEEQFGMSFNKYEDTTVNEIIKSVNEVIDANLRMSREDGRLEIKLNRQDYIIDDLYELNNDTIISVKKYTTNSTTECVTEYKIQYTDILDDFTKKIITFTNDGKFSENNQVISKTEDYSSITDINIAKRLALRNALPLTQQYIKINAVLTTLPKNLYVGDVVSVNLPIYNIKKMPMRIAEIELGDVLDTTITVFLVQDLFAPVLYTNTANNNFWQPIDYSALDVDLKLIEAPFSLTSDTSNTTLKSEVLAMCKNINNVMIDYNIYNDLNQIAGSSTGFTPTSTLFSSINRYSNIIVLANDSSLSVVNNETETNIKKGYNIAVITEGDKIEFISFTVITSNILSNVKRGLYDTIPQNFTTAAQIRFYTYGYSKTTSINYNNLEQAKIKAQTRTIKEELDLNTATLKTLTVKNKNINPINVNNLKINTLPFNDNVTIGLTNLINLSYSFRNKQKQFTQYYEELAENIDDNDVIISFYNTTTNALITEISTKLNNFTFTNEASFNGGVLFNSIKVEIKTKKLLLESSYKYTIIIERE